MSNPQPILTYLATFTPAITPDAPLIAQLTILVPTAVGVVFFMYTGYVVSGTPLRYVMTSARRQILLNRLTGSFYIATASLLAVSDSRK